MLLLYIEDSERLRRSVALGLRGQGWAVDVAADGVEGLYKAREVNYDVIVLDLMLPQLDGLSVLHRLREGQGASRDAHVLVLSARDSTDDRVLGLRQGADDYLVKPFSFQELQARIEALVRRAYGRKAPQLSVADLTLDPAKKIVTRAGRRLSLSPSEYQLLEFLAHRVGDVVTRREIEAHLYDENAELTSNAVDRTVCVLRKKLAVTADSVPLLHTRRGLGYQLGTR
jgi:DNA-binding response OmpR family regulator